MRRDSTKPEEEIIQTMLCASSPSSVSYFILSAKRTQVQFSVSYSVESRIEEAAQKRVHLPSEKTTNVGEKRVDA